MTDTLIEVKSSNVSSVQVCSGNRSHPWKNSKFCKLNLSCHSNGLFFKEKGQEKPVTITSVP